MPPEHESWGRDHDTGELVAGSDPRLYPDWRWPLERIRDRVAIVLYRLSYRIASPWKHFGPASLPTGGALVVSTWPHGQVCPRCGHRIRPGDIVHEETVEREEDGWEYVVAGYCTGCMLEIDLAAQP